MIKSLYSKIKLWLSNNKHSCFIFIGFIPLAIRFFLRFTSLAMVLAAVPIDKYVVRPLIDKVGLGEVSARIISFIVTFALMLVGWQFAEIIVILLAIAFTGELITLIEIINDKCFGKILDSVESYV